LIIILENVFNGKIMSSNHLDISRFGKCSCGLTVDDEGCEYKDHYSTMGWFWFSMGMTATPKKVDFICTKCDKIFFETTDRELIKHYLYYRPY
jgi:hypothetical protein